MAVIDRKPVFSGHETFQCRHLWLKKGYDFVKAGKSFASDDAVVDLGVGKNMVNAVRYWMRAFGLIDDRGELTTFADHFFSNDGFDPFLEDDASLWILHHQLVHHAYATSYSLIFNELRKERIEFSKENFVKYIQSKSTTLTSFTFNANTVGSDFEVFVKLYVGTDSTKDKEDIISGIFPELQLVQTIQREKQPPLYCIETTNKDNLPPEAILFALLSDPEIGLSVSLDVMERRYDGVGSIFAINRSGLVSKIERLCEKYDYLVYSDDSGIRELQFKEKPDPFTMLKKYYDI